MRITVRFFAILRDRAGVDSTQIDLDEHATVQSAVAHIKAIIPAAQDALRRAALAVNREYVKADHVLHDGDELALIPPVSGG